MDSPTQQHMYYRAMLLLAGWESESNQDLMPAINTLQALVVSIRLQSRRLISDGTDLLASQKNARKSRNDYVALVASLAKFRIIMANSYLDIAADALDEVKALLTISQVICRPEDADALDLSSLQPVIAVMLAQFLILAVPFETRRGKFQTSSEYLILLHQLMDQSIALNEDAHTATGRLEVSCRVQLRTQPPANLVHILYFKDPPWHFRVSCISRLCGGDYPGKRTFPGYLSHIMYWSGGRHGEQAEAIDLRIRRTVWTHFCLQFHGQPPSATIDLGTVPCTIDQARTPNRSRRVTAGPCRALHLFSHLQASRRCK